MKRLLARVVAVLAGGAVLTASPAAATPSPVELASSLFR
jgi:hypothetical protein